MGNRFCGPNKSTKVITSSEFGNGSCQFGSQKNWTDSALPLGAVLCELGKIFKDWVNVL